MNNVIRFEKKESYEVSFTKKHNYDGEVYSKVLRLSHPFLDANKGGIVPEDFMLHIKSKFKNEDYQSTMMILGWRKI